MWKSQHVMYDPEPFSDPYKHIERSRLAVQQTRQSVRRQNSDQQINNIYILHTCIIARIFSVPNKRRRILLRRPLTLQQTCGILLVLKLTGAVATRKQSQVN